MIASGDIETSDLRLDRFGACLIKDVTYKTVDGKELRASIVVPQGLSSGQHPIMVRWHGGGLVNGHRLYTPWFARYLLDYLQEVRAIVVLPDYRLLPGVSGLEILEDIRDFFTWLFEGNLSLHLECNIEPDLGDVLVSGESAGGWLAIQSALTQGPERIKAVVAQYPMVDMRDDHWTKPDSTKYLGGSNVTDPRDLAKFYGPQQMVITSRMPPDGGEIYHFLVRQGLYGKAFGEEKDLYPLELLDGKGSLPPIWLVHGVEDTIVPPSGTIKLAKKASQQMSVPVHLTICPGGEHLFDVDIDASEGWVKSGLEFVGTYWPKKRGLGKLSN